jgi:hypothetical protein
VQHHQQHNHNTPTQQQQFSSNGKSQSKTFAKNFIIDQQSPQQLNPSVRYFVSPSSSDARGGVPLRTPNLAPGYYQINEGGNILPSVQACGPQYVFDNYAYKPGFSYMPPTYSASGMGQHLYSNRVQQQQPSSNEIKSLPMHRSSDHLDSMGTTVATGNGTEFISIKYVSPMGHAGSRLVKGGEAMVSTAPNGAPGRGGMITSGPVYPANPSTFHFLPSGGSQHSLNNFPAASCFINPYPNVVQNSYRMINYDLIHHHQQQQQLLLQQQAAIAAATTRHHLQDQSQTETDTTGGEESDAASTLSRGKEKKETTGSTGGTVAAASADSSSAPQSTGTPPPAGSLSKTVIKGGVHKAVTTTRISKPVSTNWVLTGGARSVLARAEARSNYLRSTNGYYDDSVNDRVMLGGSGKQNERLRKYLKICGITSLVSFVIIALVLATVFGVLYSNKSK